MTRKELQVMARLVYLQVCSNKKNLTGAVFLCELECLTWQVRVWHDWGSESGGWCVGLGCVDHHGSSLKATMTSFRIDRSIWVGNQDDRSGSTVSTLKHLDLLQLEEMSANG